VKEIECRNDQELGKPTYERSSQRDDFFVFLIKRLQSRVMVRTKIEFERNAYSVIILLEISPHICLASHQIMALIILRIEID
jgi:hypothetical protein